MLVSSVQQSDSLIYPYCCRLASKSDATPATLWTVAHQAPLSMGFPRQEYWSGLPFPSPEDLPDLGIEPTSPALQADSLPLSHWKAHVYIYVCDTWASQWLSGKEFFLRFFFIISYYSILSIVVACAVQ